MGMLNQAPVSDKNSTKKQNNPKQANKQKKFYIWKTLNTFRLFRDLMLRAPVLGLERGLRVPTVHRADNLRESDGRLPL